MDIFTTLLVQPLANGLAMFIRLFGGNLGIAIIVFTIILRTLLNPLTKPYLETMKKMRDYAPELDKLKKKYSKDKVKMAQAQADFYKSKGINPGAGCIPQILQIVVLIGFFQMFIRILGAESPMAAFNELMYPPLTFPDGYVINTNFLYMDLTEPDVFNVPFLPFAIPGLILILSALAQFVSSKMMSPAVSVEETMAKKTTGKSDDLQASMQKSMVYTFPLFTIIFGMKFPAGLALYWLTISIFQAYQQQRISGWGGMAPWITRLGLVKLAGTGGMDKKEKNPKDKNGKKN